MSDDGPHWHQCELAECEQSFLRAVACWKEFPCDDSYCKGKRYCPPCLENVVTMSAEFMGDYLYESVVKSSYQ